MQDLEIIGKSINVESDGTDQIKIDVRDVDLSLLFDQFSVPDLLDYLEFADIHEYVIKGLNEDE